MVGVLFLSKLAGFDKVGGVEYDDDLYQTARMNFEKMNYNVDKIIHKDASRVTYEIDEYNYFFFYDPFEGKQFVKTVRNILDSYQRKTRKIIIIYASPQCDDILRSDGKFVLTKKIEADCLQYPGINIYVLE